MRSLAVVLSAVLCAAPALAAAPKTPAPPAKAAAKAYDPGFSKIMIVIFENTNYPEALKQPFFKRFAETGALLTNYHAITHPSQPNYVALVAGDTMGVIDDGHYDIVGKSLADLLAAKGVSWGVYAENLRGVCAKADKQGLYRRKHEPFISFKNVQSDPRLCRRIRPASALAGDIKAGRVPDFSLYIPNMNDDAHDTNAAYADKWFRRRFGPILADKKLMKTLVVVATFDEDWKTQQNHIYTALNGAGVEPGARSDARWDHYSLLRTVEDAFALGTLGRNDAKAAPIEGIWRKK
ncbi:MAG: hypothetical protein KGM24_08565 [Elusimicrobia bacterium]|nr:hypothetical protein [Elusimicrobiota bacterium]